jgi:hypothetical protein
MANDTIPARSDSVREAALNAALAQTLRAPATPSDLRAGVLAAIARERPTDWQTCRRELELEHRVAIAALNRRYLRRCRDALLLVSGLLTALGFCIKPLSQWLTPFFADAAPMVAGLMTLAMGGALGAAILRDLFKHSGGAELSS